MGPFINTLPVRIGVGEEGAEAAVRRTHALLADLLRHEHASLALAQRCSGVAAPAPLFTSLLNYRYARRERASQEAGQPGEGVRGIRGQERTNYPVMLSVDDLGEAFSLAAQVAAPADAEQVCRMMHTALERLVEALEVAPGRAIGSIDVLPEAERAQVVEEWNRDGRGVSGGPVHPRAVRGAGGAHAGRGGRASSRRSRSPTRELNARANRLAHHLRRPRGGPGGAGGDLPGAEPGDGGRAPGRAQGRAARTCRWTRPIRPSGWRSCWPTPALRCCSRRSRCAARCSSPARRARGGAALDGAARSIAAESAETPRAGAGPDDLAYVIYTSGIHGQPQGRRDRAREHRGAAGVGAGASSPTRSCRGAGVDVDLLRPLGLRAVRPAGTGRAGDRGGERAGAAAARPRRTQVRLVNTVPSADRGAAEARMGACPGCGR